MTFSLLKLGNLLKESRGFPTSFSEQEELNMPKDRARARTACRIVGVDPDRFNEMAAAGTYPCAPPTRAGAARIFDLDDMVSLWVFRRLTERGMSPGSAGPIACDLRRLLVEHPGATKVLCIWDGFNRMIWLLPEHVQPDANVISGVNIESKEEWDLRNAKANILHGLNEEDRIAGED